MTSHHLALFSIFLTINGNFSALIGVDKLTRLDDDKWTWEEND